ncbi:alpha-hydroxy acid oxidase [Citricoccus nitrophenolicus]|uniref:Alpha-hydroxy acid oxidase n=1 Tax=Citricoccus nitrophenolicus TaxID=863575 RepID=A0ABV0ILH1_9MICC|nr:alpha-hydroxy acid oxidase [Citricoccus sp. I39-566]WMY79833.1 alpha-hydroxy acid oxidase [Citricoccus sp. I39-566]
MTRRLPQPSELLPLMRFRPPTVHRRAARLAAAADLEDLRRIARRRTPRAAFDYVDGAAGSELTARRTREAFAATELLPRILHSTPAADLSTTIAGGASALPFGIAPTGFTRFMHAEGEDGGASAAAAAGIPFTLSTMGTRSIEEVAAVSGAGRRWFQLYLWKDRERSLDLLRRAEAAGFDTLLVTVDTPVAGQRLRDVRNGMTIPPQLTLRTVLDASYRPEWWFNFLSTDPLTFASLSDTAADLPTIINGMFDPTLSIADLEWIRSVWPGQLFVKGILTAEDTRRSLDAGADGLVVSNHGGRQLDRAPVSLKALGEVRAEAGTGVEVILDSGIMSGADIVSALALGADFVLIGRAYLYGLMAGGEQGVARAIELLAREVESAMMLMGTATIAQVQSSGQVRAPWLEGTGRDRAAGQSSASRTTS